MMFKKLFKRNSNSSDTSVVDGRIEGIKKDIEVGSAEVIQKLSSVQKQLRKSKKTLVIGVEEHKT